MWRAREVQGSARVRLRPSGQQLGQQRGKICRGTAGGFDVCGILRRAKPRHFPRDVHRASQKTPNTVALHCTYPDQCFSTCAKGAGYWVSERWGRVTGNINKALQGCVESITLSRLGGGRTVRQIVNSFAESESERSNVQWTFYAPPTWCKFEPHLHADHVGSRFLSN